MKILYKYLILIIKGYYLVCLKLKLKMIGVSYQKGLRGKRVIIRNEGVITIGKRVRLNSFPDGELYKTILMAHCKDSEISIGDHCVLNGTIIHCRSKIIIGNYCMFGPGAKLVDNDSHRISIDIFERRKAPVSLPIIIHNNVWVGMHSLILKGVEIGDNSIIAAYSVVTKDVPANTLVAGNPARIIKYLN